MAFPPQSRGNKKNYYGYNGRQVSGVKSGQGCCRGRGTDHGGI